MSRPLSLHGHTGILALVISDNIPNALELI